MNERQLADLKRAVTLLENPNFGAKVANAVGTPIEKAITLLPNNTQQLIGKIAQKSILAALKIAIKTMDHYDPISALPPPESSDWWHAAASMATGAVGGAFGLAALAVELPITTTIMVRSIADIARSEGVDLRSPEAQLECISIFAMGGPSSSDDGSEIGYFIAREAMTRAVAQAAAYVAKNGIQKETAPALVRLILAVAERFSIPITQKAAAQAIPVVGAVGGALINTIFMDHFQDMARGHFTVLRLEAEIGADIVRAKYQELRHENA